MHLTVAQNNSVHKFQGLTLSNISVYFVTVELSFGATRVAFIKVRHLEDILTEVAFAKDSLVQTGIKEGIVNRLEFEHYLK